MTYAEIITSPLWEGLDVYHQKGDDGPANQSECFEAQHEWRSLFFEPVAGGVFMVARTPLDCVADIYPALDLPAWALWLREGGEMPGTGEGGR